MTTVQSMWVGERLAGLHRLSIRSFLDQGHDYHLYTYGDVENVPEGVIVKDGREILGEEFAKKDMHGTWAFFADRFRLRMLIRNGGWWVDTDVICVRPFDFDDEYVFGYDTPEGGVNNAVIKAPPDSLLLKVLDENAFSVDEHRKWGMIGPELLTKGLHHEWFVDLKRFIRPKEVFYAYGLRQWQELFVHQYDNPAGQLDERVHGIHLGSTFLQCVTGLDELYPEGTIIGHFQRKYR